MLLAVKVTHKKSTSLRSESILIYYMHFIIKSNSLEIHLLYTLHIKIKVV